MDLWQICNLVFTFGVPVFFVPAFILQAIALFGSLVRANVSYWYFGVARGKTILDLITIVAMVFVYDKADKAKVTADMLMAIEEDLLVMLVSTAFTEVTLMFFASSWLSAQWDKLPEDSKVVQVNLDDRDEFDSGPQEGNMTA